MEASIGDCILTRLKEGYYHRGIVTRITYCRVDRCNLYEVTGVEVHIVPSYLIVEILYRSSR